jgi:fructose-bisphosphate aldolase class II
MTSIESVRALYARTRKERFALGAFNVDNQETLIAIARAAAAKKSAVLVEASHGEVEMIGLKNLRMSLSSENWSTRTYLSF